MSQYKTSEKRRAILIGSQTYSDSEFEQLHCPRNDVAELKFLFETDSFKFDEVIDLVDQESSHVEQQIEAVLEDSKVGDFILIYFSGHGEREISMERELSYSYVLKIQIKTDCSPPHLSMISLMSL